MARRDELMEITRRKWRLGRLRARRMAWMAVERFFPTGLPTKPEPARAVMPMP